KNVSDATRLGPRYKGQLDEVDARALRAELPMRPRPALVLQRGGVVGDEKGVRPRPENGRERGVAAPRDVLDPLDPAIHAVEVVQRRALRAQPIGREVEQFFERLA